MDKCTLKVILELELNHQQSLENHGSLEEARSKENAIEEARMV